MPRLRVRSRRSDHIAQDADALDLDFANITRLHEDRRLARRTDAGGRSSDDQIARLER